MRVSLGKNKAEPGVAPAARAGVAPERHSAVPREVTPATAAQQAERAARRTLRVGLRAATVAAVPVLAPLKNVAAHVVQA